MTKPTLNKIVTEALEDIKGIDIVEMDVRELTSIVDTMVIATGTSSRQVKALADNVEKKAKEAGFRPLSTEGRDSADWVLIDFGNMAVHLMLPEARELYDLERLWSKIPRRESGN
jgi:ribosome-associated protein